MKRLLACLIVFGAVLSVAPRAEATDPPCWQVCCGSGTDETACTLVDHYGTTTCWAWGTGAVVMSDNEPRACP